MILCSYPFLKFFKKLFQNACILTVKNIKGLSDSFDFRWLWENSILICSLSIEKHSELHISFIVLISLTMNSVPCPHSKTLQNMIPTNIIENQHGIFVLQTV